MTEKNCHNISEQSRRERAVLSIVKLLNIVKINLVDVKKSLFAYGKDDIELSGKS